MTILSGPERGFDLADVDLFDLVGALRLDRPQLIALLDHARMLHAPDVPRHPISARTSADLSTVELRQPVHVLADLLTMTESARRPLEQISVCYVGDGQADLATSLLMAGALLGMDIRIAAPRALWPAGALITAAQDLAARSGANLLVTPDAGHAVLGAMFVVAGSWLSGTVLAGDGTASPAYEVNEEFLASSRLRCTRTLFGGPPGAVVPAIPHTLEAEQAVNRQRVMETLLTEWPGR